MERRKPFQRFLYFAGLPQPAPQATSCSCRCIRKVARYIASQEEHHRKKSFADGFKLFIKRYKLQWHDD